MVVVGSTVEAGEAGEIVDACHVGDVFLEDIHRLDQRPLIAGEVAVRLMAVVTLGDDVAEVEVGEVRCIDGQACGSDVYPVSAGNGGAIGVDAGTVVHEQSVCGDKRTCGSLNDERGSGITDNHAAVVTVFDAWMR